MANGIPRTKRRDYFDIEDRMALAEQDADHLEAALDSRLAGLHAALTKAREEWREERGKLLWAIIGVEGTVIAGLVVALVTS